MYRFVFLLMSAMLIGAPLTSLSQVGGPPVTSMPTNKWVIRTDLFPKRGVGKNFDDVNSSGTGVSAFSAKLNSNFPGTVGTVTRSTFTASQSGTTLTVTVFTSGTSLAIGMPIDISDGTVSYVTALGTGTGGAGTYTLNQSRTVASQTMYGGTNGQVPFGAQGYVTTPWDGQIDGTHGHPAIKTGTDCNSGNPIYCYQRGEDVATGGIATVDPYDGGAGTYIRTRNGGAVRFFCDFSHLAFDDPLVFPKQPGKSHLHTFFGNTSTGGNTTSADIASKGYSTCSGGLVNRTGYWVPTMIYHCPLGGIPAGCNPLWDGTPIIPSFLNVYYKSNFGFGHANTQDGSDAWNYHFDTQSFAPGHRMIGGVPTATPSSPSTPDTGQPAYNCRDSNGADRYSLIGGRLMGTGVDGTGTPYTDRCLDTDQLLVQNVSFPSCWDGINLDSPGHNGHMRAMQSGVPADASGGSGRCPTTHPVPMPGIAYLVETHFGTVGPYRAVDMQFWRLSSDNYPDNLPAGYSGHADWMNGWKPATMAEWVDFCLRKGIECSDDFIGTVVGGENPPFSGWRVLNQPYLFRQQHQ